MTSALKSAARISPSRPRWRMKRVQDYSVAILFSFILIAFLPACTSRSRYCSPPELTRTSGLIQLSPTEDEFQPTEAEILRAAARARSADEPPSTPGRRTRVLVLSGGGMYGAYTVGVLNGWTTIGTRPEFDVVTGISIGALIANYAFLGPTYDRQMVASFTNITTGDVYRKRLAPAGLLSDAVASSAPLKKMIENQVDDIVLAAVAQAHLAGRRLYVGTTNIDTRRLVIWDMGAIATSGRPDAKELYRKVLLASASPPGFLPPVPIEVEINGRRSTELHVDGGATTGLFLEASSLKIRREALKAGRQPLLGSDAYVIVAGKLYVDPSCNDRRALKLAESALRSLIYSQTRSELSRIYALCQASGMGFHLTSIPEDLPVEGDIMSFNPVELRRLYDSGHAAITSNRAWRDTPPGGEPQEQIQPRSGNQFLAPGVSRAGE